MYRLFFDTELSHNRQVSCAICHHPGYAFTNGERFAILVSGRLTGRNVSGLINVAEYKSLFWDGRVAALEEQALIPIQDPDEMGMSLPAL